MPRADAPETPRTSSKTSIIDFPPQKHVPWIDAPEISLECPRSFHHRTGMPLRCPRATFVGEGMPQQFFFSNSFCFLFTYPHFSHGCFAPPQYLLSHKTFVTAMGKFDTAQNKKGFPKTLHSHVRFFGFEKKNHEAGELLS